MTAGTTEELRDRLTRQHLARTGEAPEPADVRRFSRDWWDGAVRVPSLLVRLPGAGRCRIVQTGGAVVALPASRWRARRTLARLRQRPTVDPRLVALAGRRPDPHPERAPRMSLVAQRSDHPRGLPLRPRSRNGLPVRVVHIEQQADIVRCGSANCAALVPIPPPGRLQSEPACPGCGRIELPAQQMSPGTVRRVALL
ncbi:MAG: hypothetical protein ACJ735_00060 [Actinomycetes bacterium]